MSNLVGWITVGSTDWDGLNRQLRLDLDSEYRNKFKRIEIMFDLVKWIGSLDLPWIPIELWVETKLRRIEIELIWIIIRCIWTVFWVDLRIQTDKYKPMNCVGIIFDWFPKSHRDWKRLEIFLGFARIDLQRDFKLMADFSEPSLEQMHGLDSD